MANKRGRVFSVVDDMIDNHNPGVSCENCKKPWVDIKRSIPRLIKVRNSHDIVRDIDGSLLCRPNKFTMDRLYSGQNSRKFHFYSSVIRMGLTKEMERLKIRPNVLVALGGARIFSWELLMSLRNSGYYLEYGNLNMHKILEGEEGRMVGVELGDDHHIPNFNVKKLNAFIVEDFVDTGSRSKMAVEKMRALGSKVLGVVSLTNSLGVIWPFDVPLNLAFVNLSFKKYPAGTCPRCKRKESQTRF